MLASEPSADSVGSTVIPIGCSVGDILTGRSALIWVESTADSDCTDYSAGEGGEEGVFAIGASDEFSLRLFLCGDVGWLGLLDVARDEWSGGDGGGDGEDVGDTHFD